jgi:hypothetical protein
MVVHTFTQKDVPHSLKVVSRERLHEERRKPATNVRYAWPIKCLPENTDQGRQTRMGATPISVNSFFAIVGLIASIALANNDASISN